jgi:hypothetical protein
MKRFLLSALCAAAALSLLTADSQAQTPNGGAGGRRHAGAPEEHVRQIISKYDKDGDHALNATELAAFFDAVHQRVEQHGTPPSGSSTPGTPSPSGRAGRHAAGTAQERATRAIEKFDKNGDGKLDATELVALLHAVRERVTHDGQAPRRGAPATPAPGGTKSA